MVILTDFLFLEKKKPPALESQRSPNVYSDYICDVNVSLQHFSPIQADEPENKQMTSFR